MQKWKNWRVRDVQLKVREEAEVADLRHHAILHKNFTGITEEGALGS